MSSTSNPNDPVHAVVAEAEADLKRVDVSPFSPPAFGTLKAKISEYVVELLNESIKVSKRHRADTVSAAHVERAAEYLVSSTSRRSYRHLGTVGGILLVKGDVRSETTCCIAHHGGFRSVERRRGWPLSYQAIVSLPRAPGARCMSAGCR